MIFDPPPNVISKVFDLETETAAIHAAKGIPGYPPQKKPQTKQNNNKKKTQWNAVSH